MEAENFESSYFEDFKFVGFISLGGGFEGSEFVTQSFIFFSDFVSGSVGS
jgi:hypothetical protein